MFTVVLDACVLVPITLADLLLRTSQAGGFGVRWSSDILAETRRNMERLGVSAAASQYRTDQMANAFPFASAEGYEGLSELMTNDPKDRHVLAAAVKSGCDTIVTFNLKDFPRSSLSPWGVEAVHPDMFLLGQLDLSPGAVVAALRAQSESYRHPERSVEEILGTLARTGVPEFADEALRHFS